MLPRTSSGYWNDVPMKTYTFVNDKAYSAGAYIAAATDKISCRRAVSLARRRR